jgi:ribosomal protein S18 acetylase RimI-like enzyme
VLSVAEGRVTLLVHPDNDAARALYDSEGFGVVGRRPEFYADADALVMARRASSE